MMNKRIHRSRKAAPTIKIPHCTCMSSAARCWRWARTIVAISDWCSTDKSEIVVFKIHCNAETCWKMLNATTR